MKKFYYKKEDTVEKKPIILERRNTTSKDGKEEVENRLSTRTTSLGSVDQLKEASLIPRIQSREITKCLSEDVLSRGYMKNPGKVITERELAASKLYKTRKASVNSKDSPQKVPRKDELSPFTLKDPKFKPVPVAPRHKRTDSSSLFPQPVTQNNDLSPVALKDPKFKPVPVAPKDRRKRESSCLCYLGVFTAICLCTIGLLAAVTGLLYGQVFSDKNSTSQRLEESMIDLTNLIQNNLSIHEYHALNNETFARGISFKSADYDSSEIRRSGSNLIESEDTDAVQFRQMDMTDLSRLLDDKKAEIRFRDRDTTIFEVNTSSSAEQENNVNNLEVIEEEINDAEIVMVSETDGPNILNIEHKSDDPSIIEKEEFEETEGPSIFDNVEQRENGGAITDTKQEIHDTTTDIEQPHYLYINGNIKEKEVSKLDSKKEETNGSGILNIMEQETDNLKTMKNKSLENDSSKSLIREDFEVFDEKTEVDEEEKAKYIDGLLNSHLNALKDFSDIDLNLGLNLSDKKLSDGPDDHSTISLSVLENQPVTFTDAVTLPDAHISKPRVKLSDINLEYKTKTVLLPKDKVVWKAGDSIKVSNVHNESELLLDKEIPSENLAANSNSKTEHDVEEMLEVINESGDNGEDPFAVNRNGDIDDALETSSLGSEHNLNLLNANSEDGGSSVPMRTESQSPKKDQVPKETLRVKPSNMKVSLAEAMKHLQTLDVNNKILTSRMKSPKPKAQTEKPSKLSPNKQRKKENIGADRMQYLHNLRLALQGNLIGF